MSQNTGWPESDLFSRNKTMGFKYKVVLNLVKKRVFDDFVFGKNDPLRASWGSKTPIFESTMYFGAI